MLVFDKQEIRDSLSIDDIFDLLEEWGGEPERCPTGLIARTICHNRLNDDASRKLYYYENTGLFRCYTGCEDPVFDIFQLCIKVMNLQNNVVYDLNDAVRWIARRFGISGKEEDSPEDVGENNILKKEVAKLENLSKLFSYSRYSNSSSACCA